jgi:hypothetical protein
MADPPALPTIQPTPVITGSMLPDMSDDLGIPYIAPTTDANFTACANYATSAGGTFVTTPVPPVGSDWTMGTGFVLASSLHPLLYVSGRLVTLRAEVMRNSLNILFNAFGAPVNGAFRILSMGGTVTKYRPPVPVVVTLTPTASNVTPLHGIMDTAGNLDVRGSAMQTGACNTTHRHNIDASWLML